MTMDINFMLFFEQGVALVAWIVAAAGLYSLIEKFIPGQATPDPLP
jgi:hypothetical protein